MLVSSWLDARRALSPHAFLLPLLRLDLLLSQRPLPPPLGRCSIARCRLHAHQDPSVATAARHLRRLAHRRGCALLDLLQPWHIGWHKVEACHVREADILSLAQRSADARCTLARAVEVWSAPCKVSL